MNSLGRQNLKLSRILTLSVIEERGPLEPQSLKLWRRKHFYLPHGFSDSYILHSGYMVIGSRPPPMFMYPTARAPLL